jgi:serine/threonine protein kinase/TolB-like protein
MNQERWQRLKEIIADALEEDSPAARTAMLTRVCAEDEGLLREAESFLQGDVTLTDKLDNLEECAAIAAAALRRGSNSMTGRRIGAYVIVRELGRGGMGAVYLAARADGYFEKQVAIKVLKPSESNTAELLARFRAEREVLASLEHPNIATLFDAGMTDDGMPYFVMEYVSGTAVTSYIEEHELTIPQRLELFLKICAAVEAAHRGRVVHRDLKRSNILVNENGEPKLLDFGIAKLLGEHPIAMTVAGQQRLTPISASPEQARGEEVTTASDVYALGALLYEILTNKHPHVFDTRNPNLDEVVRVVSEKDPAPPSLAVEDPKLRRFLRGDLDAIVLRAMRKNPSDRYPSVKRLAEDIHHYFAGTAIEARPDRFIYRIRRFADRDRLTAWRTVAVLLVILALVGAAVALLGHRGLPKTVTTPQPKSGVNIPEKSIAVLPFDDFSAPNGSGYFADGVQDDILTDLATVTDFKVISRTGVAPYRKRTRNIHEIGQTLGVAYVLEGSVRKLGDRIRVNAQLIDTRSDTQVWAQQYDRKMDDLFALQSDLSQAIVTQLKGKLSPSEKAAIESRPTTSMAAYDLYLRARETFVQYDYDETIKLLHQATALDPNFALAYCLLTDANLYMYRFGDDRAPVRLERAREAAETALRLAPELPESHLAQAQYYYNGLRDYEKAQKELTTAPASPSNQSKFFDLMALTERRLGHWKESLRNGEKAWELDPHDPFIATEVIQTYMSLRRYPEAEERAQRAINQVPARSTPFWSLKAESMFARGELKRAETWLSQAPGESDQKYYGLARAAFYLRDFDRALQYLETARKSPMQPPNHGLDLFEGAIYRAKGDSEKAEQIFAKASSELEQIVQKRPEDALAVMNLAWAYAGLGHAKEALQTAQRAVQLVPVWRDATEGPGYAAMQAQVQAWLGNKDAAIAQLSALVKQPGSPSYGELKFDPSWDVMRSDPRFDQLAAQAARPIELE